MHLNYLNCITSWFKFLRTEKLLSPEDALFPKPDQRLLDGKFVYNTLSRETYSNSSQVYGVFRNAFAQNHMHPYTPHSIRKTLGQDLSDRNLPLVEQKVWSQNLEHENFTTTVSSYLPVSPQRQGELIRGLNDCWNCHQCSCLHSLLSG